MRKLVPGLVALVFLLMGTVPARGCIPEALSSPEGWFEGPQEPAHAAVTLDGVTVEVTTSFLSDLMFVGSDPDSAIQAAAAVEREPHFRAFSLTAVPLGTSPPTEALPVAGAGEVGAYRAALKDYRREQEGDPQSGAVLELFGEPVTGTRSIVSLHVRGPEAVPVVITEWVAEAGERLWIVRASRELEGLTAWQRWGLSRDSSFSGAVVESPDLSQSPTSLAGLEQVEPLRREVQEASSQARDLSFPAWWDGDCDEAGFRAVTGVSAYPLGAEYRGMKACGPRPFADGGPWRLVNFGAGYSQIEWQCPEISKRFLYLAYGIPPYLGNGNQVVTNYEGDLLEKVWNCTPGRAPQPDDVLSSGATSTYGHTSVVVSSDVDSSGNGTVGFIEQNSSRTGHSTMSVRDWCVVGYTDVIGWLHHPGWLVEYYRDGSLADWCASQRRSGTYLFEMWENGVLADGCPTESPGVRFSRSIEFPGGVYTFALGYEGQARLLIDGETVVDGWGEDQQHYATYSLEAGQHQVSVEYVQGGSQPALISFWWGPGFELERETRSNERWYAEYWSSQTLWWDPVVMARGEDGFLDHHWLDGAPADGIPVDHFSSRFRRTVPFDAGRWRFRLFADDGVRFWIDDQLIVDEWQDQVAVFAPAVALGAGPRALRVEHYENLEYAKVGLSWERISDDAAPAGWVASPPTGTVIESCPVTLEALVGDEFGGVDRVEFHARYDGQWHHLGDVGDAPYEFVWDCLPVANQTALVTVHVWDDGGNEYVDLDAPIEIVLDHLESLYLPLVVRSDADR